MLLTLESSESKSPEDLFFSEPSLRAPGNSCYPRFPDGPRPADEEFAGALDAVLPEAGTFATAMLPALESSESESPEDLFFSEPSLRAPGDCCSPRLPDGRILADEGFAGALD
jgi:hypothetical protein